MRGRSNNHNHFLNVYCQVTFSLRLPSLLLKLPEAKLGARTVTRKMNKNNLCPICTWVIICYTFSFLSFPKQPYIGSGKKFLKNVVCSACAFHWYQSGHFRSFVRKRTTKKLTSKCQRWKPTKLNWEFKKFGINWGEFQIELYLDSFWAPYLHFKPLAVHLNSVMPRE